ncbi:MAG: hypothetical protein KKB21_01960, partial [Nanoarchaeota archaeon]|nr:hypothetical protein [Nanoarchaeota archaeon]
DSSPTFGETIQIPNGKIVYADCVSPAFLPILPLKEFSLSQTSSNLIYWIIGIAVVLIIVLFLVFRKKK